MQLLLQDLSSAQREDMDVLASRWRRAFSAVADADAPSEECTRRAEYLLAELQRLGLAGRPAAVQAACEALRSDDAGGHADVYFAHFHLLAPSS